MTLSESDYHHACSPQNTSPCCGSTVPSQLSILFSGHTEAINRNPKIQRESGFTILYNPRAHGLIWMYSKEIFTDCSFQYWKRKGHLPHFSLKPLRAWQEEEAWAGGEAEGAVG